MYRNFTTVDGFLVAVFLIFAIGNYVVLPLLPKDTNEPSSRHADHEVRDTRS
jgi:hypothetical protein